MKKPFSFFLRRASEKVKKAIEKIFQLNLKIARLQEARCTY